MSFIFIEYSLLKNDYFLLKIERKKANWPLLPGLLNPLKNDLN
jgi:hypothetical protein